MLSIALFEYLTNSNTHFEVDTLMENTQYESDTYFEQN